MQVQPTGSDAEVQDGRALVVMHQGEGVCLCSWLPDRMSDSNDDLNTMCVDHALPDDGVFVVRVDIVVEPIGPYNEQDSTTSFREWRRVTPAEWQAYRGGEEPWETPTLMGQPL